MGGLFETLSGAAGIRAEGKSAQNLANFNAAVAEQTATAIEAQTAFNLQQQEIEAEKEKQRVRAELGAAGGTGSPVAFDLTAEQARTLELGKLVTAFEGEIAAGRARTQAEIDRFEGRIAKQRGKRLARAANIGFGTQIAIAGTPFLTGF